DYYQRRLGLGPLPDYSPVVGDNISRERMIADLTAAETKIQQLQLSDVVAAFKDIIVANFSSAFIDQHYGNHQILESASQRWQNTLPLVMKTWKIEGRVRLTRRYPQRARGEISRLRTPESNYWASMLPPNAAPNLVKVTVEPDGDRRSTSDNVDIPLPRRLINPIIAAMMTSPKPESDIATALKKLGFLAGRGADDGISAKEAIVGFDLLYYYNLLGIDDNTK